MEVQFDDEDFYDLEEITEEIEIPVVGSYDDEIFDSDQEEDEIIGGGKVYEDADPLATSTSHRNPSNLPRKHKCPMAGCDKTFFRREHIASHLNQVHRPKIPCPLKGCNRLIKPRYLKNHLERFHDNQKEVCANCGLKVPKDKLDNHIDECYSAVGRQFRCTFEGCNKAFFNERHLARHFNDVHEPSIPCPHEGCASVVKPKYLSQHIDLIHKKRQARCMNCGKDYLCASLAAHTKRCVRKHEIRYPCATCGEAFLTVDERRAHVKRAHSQVYVTCPQEGCGMSLMKKSLSKHIKNSHEKIKGICGSCGREFIKSSLWKHERTCNKNLVRRYKCKVEGCDATFIRYSGLCVHMKMSTHNGRTPVPGKVEEVEDVETDEDDVREEEQMLNIVIVGSTEEVADPLG